MLNGRVQEPPHIWLYILLFQLIQRCRAHSSYMQISNLIINSFNSFNFRCTNRRAHWHAALLSLARVCTEECRFLMDFHCFFFKHLFVGWMCCFESYVFFVFQCIAHAMHLRPVYALKNSWFSRFKIHSHLLPFIFFPHHTQHYARKDTHSVD